VAVSETEAEEAVRKRAEPAWDTAFESQAKIFDPEFGGFGRRVTPLAGRAPVRHV
jgi:hypothetical protein